VRLLLIRHGQTPANVAGTIDTALPGPGLTDLGLEQAAALPATVAGEDVEAVYVSRALRTHLTAQPLAAHLGVPLVELPGVHEVQAGDVEKRADTDSVRIYLKTQGRWADGDLDVGVPGGETGHDFFGRYDSSLQQVVDARHDTAVIVSHGAAIRTWVTLRSTNLGPRFALNNPITNTGVVVVEGEPGAWVTRSWLGTPLGGPGIDDQDPFEDNVGATVPA
jgi:broad specificity phosphatase PhoE